MVFQGILGFSSVFQCFYGLGFTSFRISDCILGYFRDLYGFLVFLVFRVQVLQGLRGRAQFFRVFLLSFYCLLVSFRVFQGLLGFRVQIDRQIDRQTDSQTDRRTDRQTDRETQREIDRQTDRQIDRLTDRQTERQTRQTDRQIDRQTERQTRQTDRQRERYVQVLLVKVQGLGFLRVFLVSFQCLFIVYQCFFKVF